MTRTISADQIDFSDGASTSVISASLRFVLPVPVLAGGGEPLVYPSGDHIGEPFTNRDGKRIEGRGIVFVDPDDQSWEAVPGDGTGVVIISPIDEDQGARLAAKIRSLSADPDDLTLDQLKSAMRYALKALKIRSTHSSDRAFVAGSLAPAELIGAVCGLYRRRASDMCKAVFVAGAGRFMGPGATPQMFEDGAVIVLHGDEARLVQRDSFETTYCFPDGRPVRISDLAVQSPNA